MTFKPILLIDGDQFIFKATAAVERETKWDDQNHVLYSNVNEAWDNLNSMIERIFERFDSREHALCFSTAPNFRKEIDATYKSHRSPRKPLCYAELRLEVEKNFKIVAISGLEADDVMGILATKPNNLKRIIVSQDKDMKTIPTMVWDGKDLVNVSEPDADYFHLYQTLIGDTSDGYKGCPGVGPKKAEAFLSRVMGQTNPPTPWESVVEAYNKAGLTEADALVQARLARILRWSDWDSVHKKPILWTPASSQAS